MNKNKLFSLGIIYLASCIWGIFVLGPKPLDIFDTSWLSHDLAQVYLAWAQYNSDPNAHWLMSSKLGYPLEMNFALFDPMPIFLLSFGKLSSFLPDRTQYFGFYFISCLIMQGLCGYLILNKITENTKLNCVQIEIFITIGSIFFIIAPFSFYRFQQHIALSSHWIVLLSIWISLYSRNRNVCKWILQNSFVVIIAAGINPYLTLMVLISQSCIVFFDFYKTSYIQITIRIVIITIAALVGFKVFGFFSASGVRDFGYGVFSMNVLGPFNSNGLGKLLTISITDPTKGQSWEGFNYQGLGIILLVSISLYDFIFSKQKNLTLFPYRAALVIISISYLLSLSTTITIASYVFKLPVSVYIDYFLSAFRASGRFFWVGGYWIILLGIISLYSYLRIDKALYILSTLLVIQLIDVTGVSLYVRNQISTVQRASIASDISILNQKSFDEIVVLPPWQCNTEKTAGGGNNYEHLGFLAADKKINTNNYYPARVLPDQTAYHCFQKTTEQKFIQNKIYALSPEFFNKLNQNTKEKLSCMFINEFSFHLCTVY